MSTLSTPADSEFWHFMDASTYEQYGTDRDAVGEANGLKSRNAMRSRSTMDRRWRFFNFIELEITETDPGLKGGLPGRRQAGDLSTGAVVRCRCLSLRVR